MYNKFVTSVVAFGLMASIALPVSAQSNTSLSQIQQLLDQIKSLQAQIQALQAQKAEVQTSANSAIIEFIQGLDVGSEGDQVTLLQTLLASDASLYPEGKITGYYGALTRRAIQRFQERNGLESVGFVGPRTRLALNKFWHDQFKEVSNLDDVDGDDDDDASDEIQDAIASITLPALSGDPCAVPGLPATSGPVIIKDGKQKIIQTGNVFIYQDGKHKVIITPNTYHEKDGKKQLLITPGMRIEKDGKFKSIIPCNGHGTTTPPTSNDVTAPVISSVNASPTHQSAVVSWITNEIATGKVYYGTTSPLSLGGALSVSNGTFQTGHSFTLNGLSAATTYYFVVESSDKKGNTATSSQLSFVTSATPDTTGPVLSAISVTQIGTSTARVTWTTNEAADSDVYFGTVTPLVKGSALHVENNSLVTSHVIDLVGLSPNTTYYFIVESKDASNNSTDSSETSFATLALPADITAPVISAVSVTPGTTTAQVLWTTNEAASSKVYYGTGTPLDLGSALTVSNSSLVTSHSVELPGLSATTTYYVVVESSDAATNTATSSESSFLTL